MVGKKVLAWVAVVTLAVSFALVGCTNSQSGSASASSASASSAATSSATSASAPSSAASAVAITNCPVIQDTDFGSVYLDITADEFDALGFEYGDSVDVVFSNGYKLENIPYFNGYYVNVGDPLVVAYPGYPHVAVATNYGALWTEAGLKEGDTANVTLVAKGAYKAQQDAFDITYTDERSDYSSDEVFANFRACTGGKLKPNTVYRSASPIDNEHNRVPYVETLMKNAGVAYVLDLSDSAAEADEFEAEDATAGVDVSYLQGLRAAGNVGLLNLSANYPSQEFAAQLGAGLVEMSRHDGPYLVHCIEGKDRTGFVCILLEALAGATYDELQADYMLTYANYYGITKESDPEKYQAISQLNLDGMLGFLAGVDENAENVDLRSIDYTEPARRYLLGGGMTEEQVDALVARLVG